MKRAFVIFTSLLATSVAFGQGGSYSSRGQGYIVEDGQKVVFDRVSADLNRGGDLKINFSGPDGSRSLSGRWRGTGIRVVIDIDGGSYGALNGDGAMSFFSDRRGLRGISYTGSGRRSGEVKISFLDNKGDIGTSESGSGNSGGGDNGYIAPSWVVGEFSGHNRSYNADVTMTIERNGQAKAEIRFDDGRRQTQTGRFRDGRLTIQGTNFDIRKTDSGFHAEQTNDRNNWTEYRRRGNGGNGGNWNGGNDTVLVPSWLEGTFSGRNSLYDAQVEVKVARSGRVTTYIRYRDGRTQDQSGSYNNGVITIDGVRFNVSKTGNGIRMEQQGDRDNRADYRRV